MQDSLHLDVYNLETISGLLELVQKQRQQSKTEFHRVLRVWVQPETQNQ